jgi:hypothetical protein
VPAASFEEAVHLAAAGAPLTALGLSSRTPSNIDRARAESNVSLLFINRPVDYPPAATREADE